MKGPITRVGHGANRPYKWSLDNSEEIARGWIVSAQHPAQLAEKLGIIPAEKLSQTLEAYQQRVDAGLMRSLGGLKKPWSNFTGSSTVFRCGHAC